MDNETIAKIVFTLCEVAERTDMSEEEETYYDMAIGYFTMLVQQQNNKKGG